MSFKLGLLFVEKKKSTKIDMPLNEKKINILYCVIITNDTTKEMEFVKERYVLLKAKTMYHITTPKC